MDITKSTLWGALVLVVLAAVLFAWRGHLLREREQCGVRLEQLAPHLAAYADAHAGALPADEDALRAAAGSLPLSTAGKPFTLAAEPRAWQQTPNRPYLWDPEPHPYVNGIHVLATDGKVYLVDTLDEVPGQ